MLIQFDQLQENIIPQFRGGEGNTVNRMYADPNNKIMRGFLAPGCTIGLHTHDTSSEIIYILSGKGKVLCDGEYEPLEAGSCHYCPKGHAHSLINDQEEGNLEFFAVVPEHGASESLSIPSALRSTSTRPKPWNSSSPSGATPSFPSTARRTLTSSTPAPSPQSATKNPARQSGRPGSAPRRPSWPCAAVTPRPTPRIWTACPWTWWPAPGTG